MWGSIILAYIHLNVDLHVHFLEVNRLVTKLADKLAKPGLKCLRKKLEAGGVFHPFLLMLYNFICHKKMSLYYSFMYYLFMSRVLLYLLTNYF